MATTGILAAITAVLTKVRSIPFDWSDVPDSDRSRPNNLFQLLRMWNDQVNREQQAGSEAKGGYVFECPACFLEMIAEENQQLLANVTTTNYTWRLHIIDRELDAGNETDMDQNLTVFGYRDVVRRYLVGFQPPNCSTMFACDEKQDFDHGSLYHLTLDMKSLFTDTTGSYLDPNQVDYIYKEPDTNADLVIGFQNPITDEPLADPLTLPIVFEEEEP